MIAGLEAIKNRYEELSQKMIDPEILGDPEKYRKVVTEHAELSETMEVYDAYCQAQNEFSEAKEIIEVSGEDAELRELAQLQYAESKEKIEALTIKLRELLMPKDPKDSKDVIVEIRAGAGGEEAALFAAVLFRMYSKYAERMGYKISVMDESETELGGFKGIIFTVEGKGAYSRLKFESGVHRVQRVPVTESGGRVHTSTATVAVLSEADDVDVELDMNDVEIDTYRSSGAGGQHINKTDSAIRLTHKPTGIVVTCQDQRSQLKNKEKAIRVLKTKLLDMYTGAQVNEIAEERRSQVGTGDRSERIRTYNYPQNRVTDHRIDLTLYKLGLFLEGDMDDVINALLTQDSANTMAGTPASVGESSDFD